mgnify:CR=1 FL=1
MIWEMVAGNTISFAGRLTIFLSIGRLGDSVIPGIVAVVRLRKKVGRVVVRPAESKLVATTSCRPSGSVIVKVARPELLVGMLTDLTVPSLRVMVTETVE